MTKWFILLAGAASCYAANGGYTVVGWNDLGVNAMDGDYSVYAIQPPYNTIHAQVIDATGKLVKSASGITVTYQAIADPGGSMNTTSAKKTNFWTYAKALYGAGLQPETGLTGNRMPGPNNQPQPMKFEAAQNWFTADGIPVTPFDDTGAKNYYPMFRVTVRDSAGKELAHTDIVTPVSDEMDCATCHASGSPSAARPRGGWTNDPLFERDFKLNILRKHDDVQRGDPVWDKALAANGYSALGLYDTVTTSRRPVLCAACHPSNALGAAGQPGVASLTSSIHSMHANVQDPQTSALLGDSTNRSACERCHPGAETHSLRGVMGHYTAPDGTLAIQCQDCHGGMAAVGDPARQGWLSEPACQSCHTGTAANNAGQLRYTTALVNGKPRAAMDQTFATQPNVPSNGLSLYRSSAGHGGLACEACHGSTHAEYPSSHPNDNVQNTTLQGHAGVLVECDRCHNSIPNTVTGGPHGMHPVGSYWVSRHEDVAEGNRTQCQVCHGTDYRGTVITRVFDARNLGNEVQRTLTTWQGFQIGCYTCHNGPQNESRNPNTPPSVAPGSLSTSAATPATVSISATDDNVGLSLWVVKQPANGTAGIDGTKATYRPNPGFEGSDSFTVAAFDTMTSSNLATIGTTVTAATRPKIASVVNAASNASGPIAPGEIVTIYGSGLGNANASNLLVNSAGLVNRSLSGTRVLFDGLAAPVLYSSDGQVNAIAPWGLAAGKSTNVQVEFGGIRSAASSVAVTAASPAIFPGAVVNPDGSINPTAPVATGQYLVIYATGGGLRNAQAIDGEFSTDAVKVAAPVTVKIGGLDAAVVYAGDAPGLVSGALQVNVQVPSGLTPGTVVPLVLTVGGVAAPEARVAVK